MVFFEPQKRQRKQKAQKKVDGYLEYGLPQPGVQRKPRRLKKISFAGEKERPKEAPFYSS